METFYFPQDFRFYFGGPRDKFDDNLKAIQLVKQLESEDRLPIADEQDVLARYVGFGDSQVMKCGEYILSEQVEESELKSLQASTLNAHYTDLDIIRAIWEGLLHLGLDGVDHIHVIDPAAGIGHFLSCMPNQLRESARVVEVELDLVTGKILQYLHPDAAGKSKVYVMGFEKAPIADQWFDLAISNVPFGDYAVVDRSIKDHTLRAAIHDYFFARALQAVKPGGIIAFITSRYTLDKKNSKVREYIARRAELLTAVRLPRRNVQEEHRHRRGHRPDRPAQTRAETWGGRSPSELGWHEDFANSSTPMGWRRRMRGACGQHLVCGTPQSGHREILPIPRAVFTNRPRRRL